jgi:hypothetical protein
MESLCSGEYVETMRDPLVSFPSPADLSARRKALRAAARQLDRAGLYIEAVANMGVLDRATQRSLNELSRDLDVLRAEINQ